MRKRAKKGGTDKPMNENKKEEKKRRRKEEKERTRRMIEKRYTARGASNEKERVATE
jgi:hypothetical protein